LQYVNRCGARRLAATWETIMSNHATYPAYPQRILVPHACYLAYAPRGAGVMCALCYFVDDPHVFGWWIGARGFELMPAYFMLESFYSAAQTRFFATEGSDLYGSWRFDYERDPPELADPVPVEDSVCHRLEALQSEFAAEWLFFADDPNCAAETADYEAAGLPVQAANIRYRRLKRFETGRPVWTFASPEADLNLVDYLRARWPLDHKPD
jgi:hypothetical protein